jgi:serpin B
MKALNLVLLILVISIGFAGCEKKPVDSTYPNLFGNKKAADLIKADNAFAIDFYKEMNSFVSSDNWMISPVSVAMALGMTYNGAEGNTKTAFEETLRLQGFTREEINAIHGDLIRYLSNADPKVTMEIANSIWAHHLYTLKKQFADTNSYYYNAEIRNIDFFNGLSEDLINSWVSDKTHGKIPGIIDAIPSDAVMYLINALYFYGTWTYQFDEAKTADMPFYYEGGTTGNVKAMQMQADLNCYYDDDFVAVDLPYGDKKFSMIVLLPNRGIGADAVTEALDINRWETITRSMSKVSSVHLYLPKFTFSYDTLLNDPLINMGLGSAFSGADFSGMLEDPVSLEISRVIHKTFIDVNEEGTEAAAVTAIEIRLTSAGPGSDYTVIQVDRPFIFAIREKASNAIVFMGKVGRPEYSE